MKNMNCFKNVFLFIAAAAIVINLSGCLVPMMIGGMGAIQSASHNSSVSKFPMYAETKAAWKPIPNGYGRLVVYWSRVSNAQLLVPGGGAQKMSLRIDGEVKTEIMDQTFVFVDLPVGKHIIEYVQVLGPTFLMSEKKIKPLSDPFDFDIKSGEIAYIQVDAAGPSLVSKVEAEPLLTDIHHFYRLSLQCDQQNKSEDNASTGVLF